ncbi:MAG TPA: hypothetical protein DDW90_08220 [Cyanobacteria bacterium UBA9971]|nr:hypothetical protein [Cyanobacteria bacterium UBA9971]HCR36135.1 hypothetical protein [Candidatus Woesebacteria bacterium]
MAKSDPSIKASIYGAVPYLSEEDQLDWEIKENGYNIINTKNNCVYGNSYFPYYWTKRKLRISAIREIN